MPALTERLLAAVEEAAVTTTDNTNTTMTVDGGSLVKEVADEEITRRMAVRCGRSSKRQHVPRCVHHVVQDDDSVEAGRAQTLASRRSNRLAARNA